LYSNIIMHVCLFCVQLCLFLIFNQLSDIPIEEERQSSVDNYQSVVVENFDENAELNLRIWTQFMRSNLRETRTTKSTQTSKASEALRNSELTRKIGQSTEKMGSSSASKEKIRIES